jgi:hypothetical protein
MKTVGRVPAGWWVVLLVLPALAPLARAGFFESHDGLFHAYRLAALDRAVRAGVLYPRWFPEFGFGYGQPVLNFYGPLSYYWGLPFLWLGADAALALKLVFATGLIASALAMYLFARLHLDRGPAIVAAVVYAYLPYHLVDLYVRGAVAEFLAFVWFPLILWAFHRLIEDADKRRFTQIGLAALLLSALLLTHSLSTLIFAPVLAAYVLALLLLRHRTRQTALPLASASTLALASTLTLTLALTSFYWLPVLTESQYVGLGHDASQGYQDHLLSLSDLFDAGPAYPYTDEPGVAPTFPLGWLQVAILAAGAILAFRVRHGRWAALFFLAVSLGSVFMLTTLSLPVWKLFERALAFLQYPWRFQALTVLGTAFLAGTFSQAAGSKQQAASEPKATLAACCLLLATGLWALWRLPYTPSTPDLSVEAMWQRDRYYGQIGATWTGEYLPIWVTEQRWAISHPPEEPTPAGTILPAGQLQLASVGYNRYDFQANTPQGTVLVLHQFHFPGWQAADSIASQPESSLGLAAFGLPARSGTLSVRLGLASSQQWATLLSLLAALAVGVALVTHYQMPNPQFPNAQRPALLLAAGYLVPAAVLIAHLALPNGYVRQVSQVNADLEDTVELLAFTADRASYHGGDTVAVTLYWRALRSLDQDYKTFVHLTDAAMTRQPAQHDGDPGGGFSPTTRWQPGELVPDTHYLALPANLAPGRYRLWAGMYQYEPLRNLTVLSADVPTTDNRILLGEIEVTAQ